MVVGITFNVKPVDSGQIQCGEQIAPIAQRFYIESGSECIAKPKQGFGFVNWQENLRGNSSKLLQESASFFDHVLDFLHLPDKPEAKYNITKFGSFTANFKALPPPIPPEYVATLFTVVISALVGSWLTPTIIGWRKAKKEGKELDRYYNEIKKLYKDSKLDEDDIEDLDKLKSDLIYTYANSKISEQHYTSLKNAISILYEEIYKKKIWSLGDDRKLLNESKNEIRDAFAKEKISEQHYKLLNEMISDSMNNQESNTSERHHHLLAYHQHLQLRKSD